MAEACIPESTFKDKHSHASGDADESFCDPCSNAGNWVPSEGYCQICEEYLCPTCLGVHKNQKITRGHTILDKEQMPKGTSSNNSPDLCVEVCKTHHPEIVRFFCKAHDEPGCVDCMTLNHTSCTKDRVQDVSYGFQATKEFKQIQDNLDTFCNDLDMMKIELENSLDAINTTYNTIQQKITSFRKQVNDYLDKMQKKITEEAENMKKEYKRQVQQLIAKNESLKSEFEDIHARIPKDPEANVNSVFVTTKRAKKMLDKMKTRFYELEQSLKEQSQQYVFRPSSEIEHLISAETPLGKLHNIINSTAKYRGSIRVKTKADKKDCEIKDCTLLDPDRMVVTDWENNCVKLINLNMYSVISRFGTFSQPCSVAAIDADQFAVTFPRTDKVQVFNVSPKLNITLYDQLQVRAGCFGIAYKDGNLAVSYVDPGRVDILDMQGTILHTIMPKQGDEYILRKPLYIIFGQDNDSDTVIVSDISSAAMCVIDFEGHVLRRYMHEKMYRSRGIVSSSDGVLFVCYPIEGCVHVVFPDFKTSKTIVHDDRIMKYPLCITYCNINHRVYISNHTFEGKEMDNKIQVYDWNE